MYYDQLIEAKWEILKKLLDRSMTVARIATFINRDRLTLYREVKKNSQDSKYEHTIAHKKHKTRNKHVNKMKFHQYDEFCQFFKKQYDPRLKSADILRWYAKNKLGFKVPSTQKVYNWINSNK